MASNSVDSALGVARDLIGRAVLALAEDQWFERKGPTIASKDLAATLVAFANAEGGVVVVGASNGRVGGLLAARKQLNTLRQTPVQFTVPPVRVRTREIECRNDDGGDDVLLVMRVDVSERVHELTNGDCYLRVGDSSHRLSFAQRQELEYDKGQAQFDGLPARHAVVDDLDHRLIANYRTASGSTGTVESLLAARNLLDRHGKVTNAGLLLFGKQPSGEFPEAYVRVLRFAGRERGTGARQSLEDESDIRIEGPIPFVIQRARKEIERLVPRRRALAADSGAFEARPIVPMDAWLEGLVNAVIHRSYSLGGDHIRVEIFPDRIEIESPGRFPGLADPSRPLEISRFARNPRIARVCADLRIGQELGEGIRRIFEEMRRVGLSDPIYRQTTGSVRLTLAAVPRLDPSLAARLPRGSQAVIDALRGASTPLGTGDISALLRLSRPATLLRLRALADHHLIRWSGKSAKDPRAVWELSD